MEIKDKIVPLLQEQFPETNFEVTDFRGDLKIKFDASLIVPVGNFLKQHDELKFNMCEDVTAVDWATKKKKIYDHLSHLLARKQISPSFGM